MRKQRRLARCVVEIAAVVTRVTADLAEARDGDSEAESDCAEDLADA